MGTVIPRNTVLGVYKIGRTNSEERGESRFAIHLMASVSDHKAKIYQKSCQYNTCMMYLLKVVQRSTTMKYVEKTT